MTEVKMFGTFQCCTLHDDVSEPSKILSDYLAYGELDCADERLADMCGIRCFRKGQDGKCRYLSKTKVYISKTLKNFCYDGSMFVKIGNQKYYVPCIELLEVDGHILIGESKEADNDGT